MMRTSNPILAKDAFTKVQSQSDGGQMTVQGTMNKVGILFLCLLASSSWAWNQLSAPSGMAQIGGLAVGMSIVGLILCIVMAFKPVWAPVLAPAYALCQGVFIGFISAIIEGSYPGIVYQAVGLTFGVLAAMFVLYKARIIVVTEKLRSGIMMATGGLMLFYLMSFVLGFFGVQMPLIHSSGLLGIGFSLFVVGLASMNLLLDFDFIERGAAYGSPRYMEWYGAFALMVTMVWLYIEILRLLMKLRDRR